MKSVDMHINVLQCICLSCIQTAIASAADTVWVQKANHSSPEIMITVHACYIYAALTLLLPLKTIHLFWVKIKVVEEFISKEMSFLSNE